MQEMAAVREQVDMKSAMQILDSGLENLNRQLFSDEVSITNSDDWSKSLIYEIAYYRMKTDDNFLEDFAVNTTNFTESTAKYIYDSHRSELISGIYIIDEETGLGKANTYLYDERTDIIYKIPDTNIGTLKVHSLEYLNKSNNVDEELNIAEVISQAGEYKSIGSISYYTPNIKGFTVDNSYMVYWKNGSESNLDSAKLIKLSDYAGASTITENGEIYTAFDYENNIWANVVTKNKNKEAWWVWIPRYSYVLDTSQKTSTISFVKTDESAHSAFTVDGNELQGIWVSKYEPTQVLTTEIDLLPYYIPDLSGFDENTTYLEVYNKDSKTFTDYLLADVLREGTLKSFCNKYSWFNYDEKIWANIKTTANDVEAWWVWIPRYAYSVEGTETQIKFVDINDNPVDGSDLGLYKVHSAFTVDNNPLKGIWVSKYEPSLSNTQTELVKQETKTPNLNGFMTDGSTKIVYYNPEDTSKYELVNYTGGIPSQTITKGGKTYYWYDYNNKIWANIVTTSNNIESWWTWIPRYSYSLYSNITDIIFTNIDDTATTNELEIPANYVPHSAFTKKDDSGNEIQLEGIWTSKYEPTKLSD